MTVTRDGIVEEAEWVVNDHNGGGTYDPNSFGYPWRIVLHTIEGSANPAMIAGHASPPHLWYDPAARKIYQTVPLSKSAFALYHYPALYETNKARALQVEIAGFAAAAASWSTEWLDNITNDIVVPLCQWVAKYMGASIDLSFAPEPGPIPGSASESGAQRVAAGTWSLVSGLYSHRHVPQNEHWDTGGLDTPRIAAHARLIIGGLLETATLPGGKEVAEVYFRRRPADAVFDDTGIWGSQDDVYDHYRLPAGAEIVVANAHPTAGGFECVLYGPKFDRMVIADTVRRVEWNQPATYTTREKGQHSIVVPHNAQVDVRATY